ncbi:MAG: hypothetical protein ABSH13_18650 [Candidatus Acidiferrum sp.]
MKTKIIQAILPHADSGATIAYDVETLKDEASEAPFLENHDFSPQLP